MRVGISVVISVAVFALSGCAAQSEPSDHSGANSSEGVRQGAPTHVGISQALPTCDYSVPRDRELSEREVRDCMNQSGGAIQAIYQRSLRSDPTIKGRMIFKMRIATTGIVENLELDPSTELPSSLANKILERVRVIKFPPSTAVWEDKFTINFFPN